ncbi:MAG: pilin, partial [Patescibacteria group bacterium]
VAPEAGSCEYFCEEGGKMPEGQVCICNPLKVDSFEEIIENISNFIFNIALVLAPLAIVWAGGMYITSSGNPTKIEEARRIIQYALIGLIIIMLSKGLIAVFYNFLQE